ncbi:MAG TPA: hypothetical protein VG276_28080 [Actinomycetes bacterium]|jgi:hypothetical protein|nr:hypothetical protein [Actinomycetes bacterium]
MPTITGEEFEQHMDLLAAAGRMLLLIPVDQLLDIVHRAETLGPILDPTTMQQGGFRRLHEQRRMLEAAQVFCNTIRQLWPDQAAALMAKAGG